jgi:hypothetical protein
MERVHRTRLREAREDGMGGEGANGSAFEDRERKERTYEKERQ